MKSKKIEEFKTYTVDTLTKYMHRNLKSLPEIISSFPNHGLGFKVFTGYKKDKYYIIEKVKFDDNRNGKIYGIEYNKDERSNKEELIKNAYLKGRWNYEVNNLDCVTDNGQLYNIGYIEKMILIKKDMLAKREDILQGKIEKEIKPKFHNKVKKAKV